MFAISVSYVSQWLWRGRVKKHKQVITFCFICGLHSHSAVHKDISKHFSFMSNCETR